MSIVFSKRTLYLKIYWYAHEFLMYRGKMGTYELRPKVSASCMSLASRIFNIISKDMYQLRPTGSTPCVSYRDDPNPHPRTERNANPQRSEGHHTHITNKKTQPIV